MARLDEQLADKHIKQKYQDGTKKRDNGISRLSKAVLVYEKYQE
jgi:hypothetical protein